MHLIQKVSDALAFCLFVKRNLTFLNCIVFVRNVKLSLNFVFYVYWKCLLENDEPVNKEAFSNGSKSVEDEGKKRFLNHLNLCKKSGNDTTNIETLYFQTVIDICISDKFLNKNQSFQDTLVIIYINIIIYLVIQKKTF